MCLVGFSMRRIASRGAEFSGRVDGLKPYGSRHPPRIPGHGTAPAARSAVHSRCRPSIDTVPARADDEQYTPAANTGDKFADIFVAGFDGVGELETGTCTLGVIS